MEITAREDKKQSYRAARNGLIWTIIILGIVGRVVMNFITFTESSAMATNIGIIVIFLTLQITVCYFWAMYKGLNKAFMFFGLIGWLGYIPLAIMKDKNPVTDN